MPFVRNRKPIKTGNNFNLGTGGMLRDTQVERYGFQLYTFL